MNTRKRIAVHATKDAIRQIKGGHPWLWASSVTRSSHLGEPGDLAVVFDDKRRFVAIGLWDPKSQIALRVLHSGEPKTIDEEFFTDRLITANELRQSVYQNPDHDAYRMVHGENDQLPGLVIDRYRDVAVIRLDTIAWLKYLELFCDLLVELFECKSVYLRTSRKVANLLPVDIKDGDLLAGEAATQPIVFKENGLFFQANVIHGQKTGHFLDQRDNRNLFGSFCEGADVLDVFCNTGGFTLNAAKNHAHSLTFIDQSPFAVEATVQHLKLNGFIEANEHNMASSQPWPHEQTPQNQALSPNQYRLATNSGLSSSANSQLEIQPIVDDAFHAMETLIRQHQRFDCVAIDPPSFAPNSTAVDAALRSYTRLASLGARLCQEDGLFMQASCSARIDAAQLRNSVKEGLAASGFGLSEIIETGHQIDHPIGFSEGSYLKAVLGRLHRL